MKTILITGSTDGIGLETAKSMLDLGHNLIIHGRTQDKVTNTIKLLKELNNESILDGYTADLSNMKQVEKLAQDIITRYSKLDVLINNAGVNTVPIVNTEYNLDIRFVVNTIAPYYLTKLLLPIMGENSRVVNLSSAAQTAVDYKNFETFKNIPTGEAYAQSKLALTMWVMELSETNKDKVIVAVNPKSYLGSKMVKDAYGIEGHSLSIGADILSRAAFSDEFNEANGKYFDNDRGIFTLPHPFAMNGTNRKNLIDSLESFLNTL